MIGFIILRHVNSIGTNEYWIECLKQIRKFYQTNKIMIIDDNSNQSFLSEYKDENCFVVNSEFKGRGELLPYHYYYKNPFCSYLA